MTSIQQLIDDLIAQRIRLDDLATDFRHRSWPTQPRSLDPELDLDGWDDPPDSFTVVTEAHHAGRISGYEYGVLAHAAVAAMTRQQTGTTGQRHTGPDHPPSIGHDRTGPAVPVPAPRAGGPGAHVLPWAASSDTPLQ